MRYHSTAGLNQDDLTEIVSRVHDVLVSRGKQLNGHTLGLYKQVTLTLVLLRQNISQMVAGDMYGVSQPTVSRISRRMLPLLDTVLACTGISLEQAVAQRQLLLVDGTFIPTGNRPASGHAKVNYSGKHRVQCLSIQVACTHDGTLIATSDPVPGSRHDSKALELVGWDTILDSEHVSWLADAAYIATTALTPIKKTRHRQRLDWEKQYNRDIARFRAPVEQAIAHLKNWKILAKGYRGRLTELPDIIRIVTRLELYRIGW